MTTFLVAVFFMLITPGPGVLSVAGVGSGYGYRAGLRYMTGLWIGTNLVALAVVSGLAGLVFSFPAVRNILMVLSVLYLAWLALRIALSGSNIAFIQAIKAPGIIDGISLQAINPKAYVVNTALFTGFAFWPDSFLYETITKFVLINAIWIPVHMLWIGLGVSLRKLALSEQKQRAVNYAMATALMIVVLLALTAA